MKPFVLCATLLATALSAAAADLTIVRVFTGWRDAASFKHISEYFNGRENTHGEAMLRTHGDERAGYYFLLRVANSGAARPIKINLQLISPTGPKLRTFAFATDLHAGDTVLNLGLTGADWPDAKANPVAWKIEVADPDGHLLVAEKSYLWEKPIER